MAEYISRAALMGELTGSDTQQKIKAMDGADAYNEFLAMVNGVNKADVAEVRHARWEAIRVPNQWDKGRCSACKRIFESSDWGTKYCSACGAKMDGGAESGA